MSTAISIAFGVGMLCVVSSCGLPFALAALWLRGTTTAPRAPGGGSRLRAAGAAGALAGAAFAATLLAMAVVDGAGVEVADAVPPIALALAVVLVVLGGRAIVARSPTPAPHGMALAGLAGLAYAIVSLPCALPLLEGLVTQTDKARGTAGVAGVAILFTAGSVTVTIALSLLGSLLAAGVQRLGTAGVTVAGALCAAAASVALGYWGPALSGGVGERGGWAADALAEASGAVGKLLAELQLAFGLLLLVAACVAMSAALGWPRAQGAR